jgi:hypothetical protein
MELQTSFKLLSKIVSDIPHDRSIAIKLAGTQETSTREFAG